MSEALSKRVYLCCCSNLCSRVALRVIAAVQFLPLAWTFFVIRHPWLSTQRPTSVSAGLLTASLHRHLPAPALCSLKVTGSNCRSTFSGVKCTDRILQLKQGLYHIDLHQKEPLAEWLNDIKVSFLYCR